MELGIREIVGAVWTGILGMLWWDIRGVRKEREEFGDKISNKYMTKKEHELVCKAVCLQIKNDLGEMKTAIIDAIKENGRRI